MCAWVRCCGGSTPKKKILSDLNTLTITSPSNTASAPSTKRTFIKDSIVTNLADNNYYQSGSASVTSRTSDTITYTTTGYGYGLAFVTTLEPDEMFTIKLTSGSSNMTAYYLMFYANDGTYLSNIYCAANGTEYNVTVPNNAKYTLIQFANTGGSSTLTINKLEMR